MMLLFLLPKYTLSQTLNAEVKKDGGIPRKKKGDGTHATTGPMTLATPLSKRLMKTKSCKTFIEMSHMMVPLISKKLTITAEATTELLVQMSAYFAHTGIYNEEYPFFVTNYIDWSPLRMIATDKQMMNLISVPVTLLLLKIIVYTVALQEEKLYLSPGISYCALSTWLTQYSKMSTEN